MGVGLFPVGFVEAVLSQLIAEPGCFDVVVTEIRRCMVLSFPAPAMHQLSLHTLVEIYSLTVVLFAWPEIGVAARH